MENIKKLINEIKESIDDDIEFIKKSYTDFSRNKRVKKVYKF